MSVKSASRDSDSPAEIVILAGGLSSRMGRDKARIRIGNRTMAGHVRRSADQTGLAVKVLRRDGVPRCGPLGGVYTGLVKARSQWVMFLACDMPLVSVAFLNKLIRLALRTSQPVFTTLDGRPGFPLVVSRSSLPAIRSQIERGRFALKELAWFLRAKRLVPTSRERDFLLNINSPKDLGQATARMADIR